MSVDEKTAVRMSPRGLGTDSSPGCFICEAPGGIMSNFAAFVGSRMEGEEAVQLIERGVRLDYRDREPNWIQIKVGACKLHVARLEILCLLLRSNVLSKHLLDLVRGEL